MTDRTIGSTVFTSLDPIPLDHPKAGGSIPIPNERSLRQLKIEGVS